MCNCIHDKMTDIGFGGSYNATGSLFKSSILAKLGIDQKESAATSTPAPASPLSTALIGIGLKKPESDKSTDQGLSDWLKWSYSGSAYPAGRDWADQLDMMPWARTVMEFYDRDVPNRSGGDKWEDRSDLFFFDAAVRYFKRFHFKGGYTPEDCLIVKEMVVAIDQEIQSIYSRRAAGAFGTGEQGHYLTILNDLRQQLLIAQAQLSCDKTITKQENQEFLDSQLDQIKAAQSLVTKPSSSSKYLVYGLIGVAAIVTVVIVFKS